jgi:phosphodiesterase/alkaline phosphatase D-like protein
MYKDIFIGLLVIGVLGLGAYAVTRKDVDVEADPAPTGTNTNNNSNPNTTPTDPGLVIDTTPRVPTVSTSSSVTPSISTALVTGQAKPNGLATMYWFDYGTSPSMTQRTAERNIGTSFVATATPEYITGLKSNTQYYFRLSAKNSLGTVNGTTYTFETNTTAPVSGKAPSISTVAASGTQRSGSNLNGRVNPNGYTTTYWFEFGSDINLNNQTPFQTINNSTTSMNVSSSLSGLAPLTKYYFRLNAQNQFGTVNGTIMNFTTFGPASSSKPTVDTTNASSVDSNGAQLNGRVNPNGAVTTYWFEYSVDSLLGNIIGTATASASFDASGSTATVKANISTLTKDTKYYYRIVAQNEKGTVKGGVVSFTTKK